jgi:hypothetical protein
MIGGRIQSGCVICTPLSSKDRRSLGTRLGEFLHRYNEGAPESIELGRPAAPPGSKSSENRGQKNRANFSQGNQCTPSGVRGRGVILPRGQGIGRKGLSADNDDFCVVEHDSSNQPFPGATVESANGKCMLC